MKVIGIGDSHLSHACLFLNGKLVSAIAEERLTRNKAEMGFPINSIKFILNSNKLKAKDIDQVAIAGQKSSPFIRMYKRDTNFSTSDWVNQNYKYYIPKLLYGKKLKPLDDFNFFKKKNKNIHKEPFYKYLKLIRGKNENEFNSIYLNLYKKILYENFKFSSEKIFFYRHEDCHKVYGVYSCPKKLTKANILTIEGGGDDSSATFSILNKNNDIREIWKSNKPSLGRLYRNITILLGMRPGHDEYKVMGLAPYGSAKKSENILKFFNKFDFVDGIKIRKRKIYKEIYLSSLKNLEGYRFDNIAYGIQNFIENILIKWSKNVMNYSKSKNLILSGGVAQNIKALNAIYNFAKPNFIWSGPVSGDGSLGIGAAILALKSLSSKKIIINDFYLGTSIQNKEIYNLNKQIDKKNIG